MAEESQSSGKNFFSTLPGIITGLAGLISAIGGLLLVLNKTGCFNSGTANKNNTEQNDSPSYTAKKEIKDTIVTNTGQTGSYSPAEIKYTTRHITYRIKEAKIETLPGKEIVLNLKIKCVNESEYEYHFYEYYLRVKIGEDKYSSDPYSPSDGYQSVPPESFKDLEYNFKLPAGTKNFNLVFYDDEKKEIGSSIFTLK